MRFLKSYLAVAAIGFVVCNSAQAQTNGASLSGVVTDQSAAVITNATVTITDTATSSVLTLTTKSDGSYLAQELRTGDVYRVAFSAPGFRSETVDNIRLLTDTSRRVDGTLMLGGTEANITISAGATQLLTENAALQDTVTERQMIELPLVVSSATAGRTPISFLFLDSGVTTTTGNGTTLGNFRVYGNQGGSTDIQIDGATTRRAQNGNFFSETTPGPDAFQEFTATTSQYSAESGASTGGVVNFAIKSGTNDFHGEVYDLLQNDKLNANTFLNDLTKQPKGRDHQNNFGANLGGPIRVPHIYNGKDRAFFFVNYEGYRTNIGENVLVTVPTAKMRTGDFSELLTDPYVTSFFKAPVQIYDPHVSVSNNRPLIPGNRLDLYTSPVTAKSVIDPVGLKLVNEYPLPTTSGVYHNYAAQSTAPEVSDAYVGKIDYIVSPKQHFDMSYSYRKQTSVKGGSPRLPFPATANGVWNQVFKSHYARFQHDYSFSASLINHINLGWNRAFVANINTTLGSAYTAPDLGIPANATQGVAGPRIGFPGYNDVVTSSDPRSTQEIGSTFFSDAQGDNSVDLADIVGWNKGKQNIRVGADIRIQQLNVNQFIDPGGSYNFRANQTGNGPDDTGWPLASLVTGATEYSYVTIHSAQPAYRFHYPAFFANDDIKVTPKLVLNIGVRYEIPFARTESHNYLRGFSPSVTNPVTGTPGALISANPANGPKAPNAGLASTYFGNVGPRIGFAWTAHPKTVLRGGWGMYYGPLQYNNDITAGTLGYSNSRLITPGAHYEDSTAFLSAYPQAPAVDPTSQYAGPNSGCFGPNQGCTDVQFFGNQYRTGLVQQFSLNVQQEFPASFVLTLGYVGHLGQRLSSNYGRLNALPYNDLRLGGPLLNKALSDVTAADRIYASSVGVSIPSAPFTGFSGNVAQALRPFPQYGFIINENETQGRDYYNGLQARLEHRFATGLQMGASYTWSKLLTNAAEDIQGNSVLSGSLQYPNATNLRAIRTVSPSDVPQSFVLNYIYELPFGKNKPFFSHGAILDAVVGGWQFAGVQRYQSDTPLVVTNGDPQLTNGFLNTIGVGGVLRPNLTGAPLTLSGQTRSQTQLSVLNPAAFSAPQNFNPGFDTTSPQYASYFANPNVFFGTAPVVLANVRPFMLLSEDMSLLKKTRFGERLTVETRVEGFNVFNRHSYANPDTSTQDGGNFGQASVLGGGRIFQLGARVLF